MTKLEKAVREYFEKCITKDEFEENNVNTLVFSFLVGMPPEECKYMEVETEWTPEEVDQYYDVEGIIHRLKMEKEGKI